MSTTVTFAGNLTGDAELQDSHGDKPVLACRAVVNRRIQDEAGEWVDGVPTAHNVPIYGAAANQVYDYAVRGDRVVVHRLRRREAWVDAETSGKRSKQVVTVDSRVGEVRRSVKYDAGCLKRQTALAATTKH